MYAKDLSRKVKTAKRQRAIKGFYISAQTPYGYIVNKEDPSQLVIDPESAMVVRRIFELALSGRTLHQITKTLSNDGITRPSVYKAISGDTRFARYGLDNVSAHTWCVETVRSILRNQVYTGDMINHKTEIVNYKTKERRTISSGEQIIVPNRHEGIIERETFDEIQTILNARCRPNRYVKNSMLKGLVYCTECGTLLSPMYKANQSGKRLMFRCMNHFMHPMLCRHNHYVL